MGAHNEKTLGFYKDFGISQIIRNFRGTLNFEKDFQYFFKETKSLKCLIFKDARTFKVGVFYIVILILIAHPGDEQERKGSGLVVMYVLS